MLKKKVILIGAGGYAKSVLDSLDYSKYTMCGFLEENQDKKEHLGYPIIARKIEEIKNKQEYEYFISIGDNVHRKYWYDQLVKNNLNTINVIDKTANVSEKATIGTSIFIGKNAIVNSCSKIGDNTIINTKSLVEHGCTVGDHVNISTNAVINGDVVVNEGSFVGSCSVTIGQLTIGKWATIGAGAVVVRNVEDNTTVAGVPAKPIKRN